MGSEMSFSSESLSSQIQPRSSPGKSTAIVLPRLPPARQKQLENWPLGAAGSVGHGHRLHALLGRFDVLLDRALPESAVDASGSSAVAFHVLAQDGDSGLLEEERRPSPISVDLCSSVDECFS